MSSWKVGFPKESTSKKRRGHGESIRKICGPLPVLLTAALLTGCASMSGFPERSEEVKGRIDSLKMEYFLPNGKIHEKYRLLTTEDAKKSYRSEVVYARMMAIDLQFSIFKEAIYEEGIKSNLALDILGVVAGGAGAAVTGAGTSRILSAVSGGISGSRTAINKNLYYERTMPALMALMEAEREKVRADIEEGLQKKIGSYPLGQALVDLERYFQVGSIPGAIASVTSTAGEAQQEAEAKLKVVRKAAFASADAQERVDKLLDLADALGSGDSWRILQNPPSALDQYTQEAVKARLGGTDLALASGKLQGAAKDTDARAILKMILVLIEDRSEQNLGKWEAAIKALAPN